MQKINSICEKIAAEIGSFFAGEKLFSFFPPPFISGGKAVKINKENI